jgi:pimeloyl-ACP methyl ester carboxylesterase
MERREFLAASMAIGGMMMATSAQASRTGITTSDLPGAPRLQLRRRRGRGQPVLYIHGATFSSALSVGYRFADGLSWEDSLHRAGFDVWALDFEGFGGSARPVAFKQPANASPVPLQSTDAVAQIARAVDTIRERTRRDRVSMIAHSWGGVPAASYAAAQARMLEKLVLFAPALPRPAPATPQPMGNNLPPAGSIPAWRRLTVAEQLARFVNDTPAGHASVLAEPTLDRWGPAWLATDADAMMHTPASVQVPTGPQADIIAQWSGNDLYDPASISMPTLIVRGEWDSVCSAADVERLRSRMTASTTVSRFIPTSGHLAHLETNRAMLWAATNEFLREA